MENVEVQYPIEISVSKSPASFDRKIFTLQNTEHHKAPVVHPLSRSPCRPISPSPSSNVVSPPSVECQPRPVARKSGVFKKRLSFVDRAPNGTKDDDQTNGWTLPKPPKQSCASNGLMTEDVEDDVSLLRYMEMLKSEANDWSTLRRARNRRYKEILKSKKEPLSMGKVANMLTEDDKKFLADRPNYREIAEKFKIFKEKCTLRNRHRDKVKTLALRVLNKEKAKVENTKKNIIFNS